MRTNEQVLDEIEDKVTTAQRRLGAFPAETILAELILDLMAYGIAFARERERS